MLSLRTLSLIMLSLIMFIIPLSIAIGAGAMAGAEVSMVACVILLGGACGKYEDYGDEGQALHLQSP